MPHAIGPDTSFQNRSEGEEHAEENGENDEENASTGVLALRRGCPGNGIEGGFE